MNYTLKYKDINIAIFSINEKNVTNCIFDKDYISRLPLPLKRLIKEGLKEEFVRDENELFYELNEDGCFLFDEWLSNRGIPINRFNYSQYINKGSTPREWLLKNNGYSFIDSYWIESETENLIWQDIIDKRNTLDTFCFVKNKNNQYKGHSATLGGQLEKFWFKKDNQVYLCKKVEQNDDILAVREYIASIIYKKQEYNNYCEYKLISDKNNRVTGCICKNFIEYGQELISVYDLLEEYNLTQSPNIWNLIIERAYDYGLDKQTVSDYLDIQTLVDFLITNRDRHQNNIAFIRDEQTNFIIKPAPIFDNGSSKYMESKNPESLYETTVNGLYETELECLKQVSNFCLIDISKLPDKEEIRKILDICISLSDTRKEFLINRYQEKVNFIEKLQKEYNKGSNMKYYIDNIIKTENNSKSENNSEDNIIKIFDEDFFNYNF